MTDWLPKSDLTPCWEPVDVLFGEPYDEAHPWIAHGHNSKRVHLLGAAMNGCMWCSRGIPAVQCTANRARVTQSPQRVTCRMCLRTWMTANRFAADRTLVDAVLYWRVYGARTRRLVRAGLWLDLGRDDPLGWYKRYFRMTPTSPFFARAYQ